MGGKRHTAEQIIGKLRTAEFALWTKELERSQSSETAEN